MDDNLVEQLVELLEDVDFAENHDSALISAVEKGDINQAQSLLEDTANINYQDECGMTALHYAASGGYIEITKMLLDYHPDIATQNIYGMTALHYSVEGGYVEITEMLLNNDPEVINKEDNKGNKALHTLTKLNVANIIEVKNSINLADMLLDRGLDVNDKNTNGDTALHLAVHHKRLELAEFFLKNGANIDEQNAEKSTPLHQITEHHKITKLLLRYGANSRLQDQSGKTAIHIAALRGYNQSMELMLSTLNNTQDDLAIINKVDKSSKTALHYAALGNNTEITTMLLINGADVDGTLPAHSPLLLAMKEGHLEVAKILSSLSYGNHLLKNEEENTLLHLAVKAGDFQFTETCISTYIIDVNSRNKYDITALHYAVARNYKNIATMLINNGADVNSQNNLDETPLYITVRNNNLQLVETLIKFEADVSLKTDQDKTIFDFNLTKNMKDLLESTSSPRYRRSY